MRTDTRNVVGRRYVKPRIACMHLNEPEDYFLLLRGFYTVYDNGRRQNVGNENACLLDILYIYVINFYISDIAPIRSTLLTMA